MVDSWSDLECRGDEAVRPAVRSYKSSASQGATRPNDSPVRRRGGFPRRASQYQRLVFRLVLDT
jgi:hypothetical protein